MINLEFREFDMTVDVASDTAASIQLYDGLFRFSYTFTGGKTYALIGSPGSGNCALTHILYGKEALRTDPDGGHILINGLTVDNSTLAENVCYAGQRLIGEPDRNNPLKRFIKDHTKRWTIAELINTGLEKTQSKYSLKDIADIFHLSGYESPNGRIYRSIDLISGERWMASLAIGYALGKRIFTYPLLTDSFFHYITFPAQNGIFDFLKSEGAIILLPSVYAEQTSAFSDETLFMNRIKHDKLEEERKKLLIKQEV